MGAPSLPLPLPLCPHCNAPHGGRGDGIGRIFKNNIVTRSAIQNNSVGSEQVAGWMRYEAAEAELMLRWLRRGCHAGPFGDWMDVHKHVTVTLREQHEVLNALSLSLSNGISPPCVCV